MHEGITTPPPFFVSPLGDFGFYTKVVFSPFLLCKCHINFELEKWKSIISLYRQAAYDRSALHVLFAKMTN